MRKIILSTVAAIAAMTSTSAFAAGSADVAINASLAPKCTISASSSALTLTSDKAPVAGTFEYSCNFVGSPTMTFTSLNGGVATTENGTAKADYGIYLNDTAYTGDTSSWLKASQAATTQTYNGITTTVTPNTTVTPSFAVALLDTLTVAGTYSDTLTITVAP
jgi:hypothetical protein